jgi:hypothetical protein
MRYKSNEQKLVDLCFEIALMISDKEYKLYEKSIEEKAEWIAHQLKECGFPTMPCGMSWGVLINQ